MRRLPPLTAVEAFVQVARLGSIKAAAEELALSSPALSRRVQSLERFVGRTLFERRHQALVLNATGEGLLARLAPAIDLLSEAIDMTTGDSEVLRLRLSVPALYASQKLIGRLASLRARHPELHLDIETAHHAAARLGDGIDAAIVLAREVDPALYARRLDRNRVCPIVSRTLVEGPNAIRDPSQLAQATVFVHRDMVDNFDRWRQAAGYPNLEPLAIDQFDSGQLILEAASQGLGVAFMLDMHLTALGNDQLVKLFDLEVDSSYSYWFACRRPALSQRAVRLFHDWLLDGEAEERKAA